MYADVIKKFPSSLQKLITRGYGCDRKLRNECCQGGCQGFRFPLDDSIFDISSYIKTWLDNEVLCLRRKQKSNVGAGMSQWIKKDKYDKVNIRQITVMCNTG